MEELVEAIRERWLASVQSGQDQEFWTGLNDMVESLQDWKKPVLEAVLRAERDLHINRADLEAADIVDIMDGIREAVQDVG